MKKGLIGIVVLALVVLVCGTSLAATFDSFDVTATMEWTIFDETGLMPGASYGAPAITVPDLTISAGPWSASTADAYIKYTAEMATVGLYASTSYAIYDLEHDITAAQGFTLAADMAPVSVDLLYTTGSEYGVGGTYSADLLSVGAKYNSTGAYGLQLVYPMAPITLTGQYAAGTLLGATTAYLVKGEYALTAGTVTLQYKVSDFPFPSFSSTEISAALADLPITDTTLLGATVTSTDGSTTITGTTATTLVEGVTLTLNVGSTAGALTYSGKIGVAL